MAPSIDQLIEQIRSLQSQLEAELAIGHANLNYTLHSGRARFEQEVLRAHKALRVNLTRYVSNADVMHIVTAPVIYSLIVPFVLLDIFITVYQAVCFPVYGIEKVKRRDYLIFDRHHLAYLNLLEKVNCAYCSYGNGLLAYAREIAGRTGIGARSSTPDVLSPRTKATNPSQNTVMPTRFGNVQARSECAHRLRDGQPGYCLHDLG